MNSSDNEIYKLSEFAELMNVSTKSLQRWDGNGLLVADRTDGCHRSYTQKHIEELNSLRKQNSSKLTRKKNYKFKDITNEYFGKLHVIERADDWIDANGHRHIMWRCECECKNIVVIKGSSLNAGYNKSCCCSQYGDGDTKRMWDEYNNMLPDEVLSSVNLKMQPVYASHKTPYVRNNKSKPTGKLEDLTDREFGFWKVITKAESRHYKNGGQAVCWKCECKCGIIKSVPGRDLKSGASQSCGCMSSISWLEYYVKQYLDSKNIEYKYQHKYSDLQGVGGKPLIYDFILIKNEIPYVAIECQGEQHYRPIKKFGGAKKLLKQQIHDKLKSEYASFVLNIPLYEITYECMTDTQVYKKMDELSL